MITHFHRLVDRRGERMACLQFRKVIKWYSHAIRPPKDLYHRLINLSSVSLFDQTVSEIYASGPMSPYSRPLRASRSRSHRPDRQVVICPQAFGDDYPWRPLDRGLRENKSF